MAGKLNENKFDEILGQALRKHSEPVPAVFTERMIKQIEVAEQRRILARVVLQERLSLAGCIVFGVLAALGVAVFPGRIAGVLRSIAAAFTERGGTFVDGIGQYISVDTIRSEWQLYIILVLVLGLAIFSVLDILMGEKLRIA